MRAWVEINRNNLIFNIKKIQELSNNKEILGVVKANAYGLGSIEITNILKEAGLSFFGVANLEEAIELREEQIKDKILVLGASFEEDYIEAQKFDNIHFSVSSFDTLKFLKNINSTLPIHLKVDTGMTRLGFNLNEVNAAITYCKENNLNLKGIFSHLSDSDLMTHDSIVFTLDQIEKFKKITFSHNLDYIHISNSAGITNFSKYIVGNLARAGLGMYGFSGDKKDKRLKNVFTVKARLVHIKKVAEDSFVSYGRHYKLKANETYGILPIGYADGMKKYLNKGSYVLINNIKCEIIGSICMDMTMIKIAPELLDNIKIGDIATIIDRDIINNLNMIELCTWDIMTSLGKRVKRVYI